jgi:hypothetical protein
MLRRRKKNGNVSDGMDGQDSFLDIVSNIVGILIILVMIAGVRAQSSGGILSTELGDEFLESNVVSLHNLPDELDEVAKPADDAMIRDLEEKVIEYKTKDRNKENIRQTMLDIQTTSEQITKQIKLQELERDELMSASIDLRADIEIWAAERGEEAKVEMELRRKISEADAKLAAIERSKQWVESGRQQATKIENLPTPISKTVEEKESHFRIKQGKIVYVPINELNESFLHEFKLNQNKFFSNQVTRGSVGPISDFVMDYVVVRYNVPAASAVGDGVGRRVVLELVTYRSTNKSNGTYYKEAITQSNSDFQRLIQRHRQDIYTMTFWVYPDSFEAYNEVKQFLYSKGYRVAARPLEANDEIKASSRGTKSSAQ